MTMHFDWSTFALQTVNFAILVWLLHRFLYRPVLRLVDARRAEIDKQYADARKAEAEALAQRAAIEAEHGAIAAARAAVLKEAAGQAEQAAAARRVQAEREAAALIEDARKSIDEERGAALAEARRAALDLGATIAERLLAEVPAALRTEAWVERVEQYLAALPAAERDGLGRQLANGVGLTVVTASPLPPESERAWQSRLEHVLGDRLTIAFDVDRDLVAGAELHFPNAILRFSWQSTLAALRKEIDADAHHNPSSGDIGTAESSPGRARKGRPPGGGYNR